MQLGSYFYSGIIMTCILLPKLVPEVFDGYFPTLTLERPIFCYFITRLTLNFFLGIATRCGGSYKFLNLEQVRAIPWAVNCLKKEFPKRFVFSFFKLSSEPITELIYQHVVNSSKFLTSFRLKEGARSNTQMLVGHLTTPTPEQPISSIFSHVLI